MPEMAERFDVLVVGAGPAGIAAACAAGRHSGPVGVIDGEASPGGQIWRGGGQGRQSRVWLRRFRASPAKLLSGARVVGFPEAGTVLVEDRSGARILGYRRLVLATGARERFLPFPGWTLPGVVGVGGLQALVKGGLDVGGKRIVVAGSGPLLLAAAASFQQSGAVVKVIAEQAPTARLARFGLGLLGSPRKLFAAAAIRGRLFRSRYLRGCWPVEALGVGQVSGVRLAHRRTVRELGCDYLACGFGLVPNVDLAALLGCSLRRGGVRVDDWQQTSLTGVYAAGELTGIGGVDLALTEGGIAGLAAVGRHREAEKLIPKRLKERFFAARLERAFGLREELRDLPAAETVFCRCEDVTCGGLRDRAGSRDARLQTRMGMGCCQGKICGPAAEFVFGWEQGSVRPPVGPVRMATLAGGSPAREESCSGG